MPLSKQTTDQIRKEAEDRFPKLGEAYVSYIKGATIWAEKAAHEKEGLVKAFEEIAHKYHYEFLVVEEVYKIATKALEQFK